MCIRDSCTTVQPKHGPPLVEGKRGRVGIPNDITNERHIKTDEQGQEK